MIEMVTYCALIDFVHHSRETIWNDQVDCRWKHVMPLKKFAHYFENTAAGVGKVWGEELALFWEPRQPDTPLYFRTLVPPFGVVDNRRSFVALDIHKVETVLGFDLDDEDDPIDIEDLLRRLTEDGLEHFHFRRNSMLMIEFTDMAEAIFARSKYPEKLYSLGPWLEADLP